MNNMNVGIKPVNDVQISKVAVKSETKDPKVQKQAESDEVFVNKMSERLNSDINDIKEVLDSKDTKEIVTQISEKQEKLAAAQSGHITMEFVSSLLNKNPYEASATE